MNYTWNEGMNQRGGKYFSSSKISNHMLLVS